MANHGFIVSKKNFKADQIRKDLEEINRRRFKGLLKIEDSQWGDKGAWFVSYQAEGWEYPTGFNIWITSQRKIEHRHAHGWGFYIELVFVEELGAKYNATFSDEGISNRWKPDPAKYPNYKAWLSIQYEHSKNSKNKAVRVMAKQVIASELKMVPKELRDC